MNLWRIEVGLRAALRTDTHQRDMRWAKDGRLGRCKVCFLKARNRRMR